jgi:hypothetical protein
MKQVIFIVCFYFLLANTTIAKDLEFPAPKNAAVSVVGNNITVSGKTMNIRQFYTKDKIDKVKKFYYKKWEKAEIKGLPGYTETEDNPPWYIISRLQQGHLLTVQMQSADDGGTWGYLASSELMQEQVESTVADSIPKLKGSEIIHDIQTKDIGQSGNTMIISNDLSLESNTNYYKSYYQQRGWRTDIDKALDTANSHVMSFTKGRDKVNLVMTRGDKSTYITVNLVTHDLL